MQDDPSSAQAGGPAARGLRRRELLLGSLGAGFALAVRPIGAATITTGSAGLTAGPVDIPVGDGSISAYRARPAGTAAVPVLLVVSEIFGVHAHIQDLCRRLAHVGYLAVAPNLFERQGDVTRLPSIEAILPVVGRVPDAQVMDDLDATVAWAARAGGGDVRRLGITGFCWGGRITWLYAAHNPALKAGVAWYGRLEGNRPPLQPLSPLDLVSRLKAPVLGLYGGKDDGIPLDSVKRLQRALQETGSRSRIVLYPEAPHGFNADYRASYRADAAADGWRRMLAWFRSQGGGRRGPAGQRSRATLRPCLNRAWSAPAAPPVSSPPEEPAAGGWPPGPPAGDRRDGTDPDRYWRGSHGPRAPPERPR
jgi:carboxymethylenebutenolidase